MVFKDNKEDKGFTHWGNGRHTGKLGISGFFLKLRGLLMTMLAGVPLVGGAPFWWPSNDWGVKLVLTSGEAIALLVLVVLIIFLFLFFYVRKRTERSLEIKKLLHDLSHESRDSVDALYKRIYQNQKKSIDSIEHERVHLKNYASRVSNIVASYFSQLSGDTTVACSIRVLSKEGNKEVYETLGRSDFLNRGRERTTESIPKDEGIPGFFSKLKDSPLGVLFIHDFDKAAANRVYKKTKNCDEYKVDLNVMAVTPINGWYGSDKDLIGLLIVTSQNKNFLKPVYVDLFRFSADIIAATLSNKLSQLDRFRSELE